MFCPIWRLQIWDFSSVQKCPWSLPALAVLTAARFVLARPGRQPHIRAQNTINCWMKCLPVLWRDLQLVQHCASQCAAIRSRPRAATSAVVTATSNPKHPSSHNHRGLTLLRSRLRASRQQRTKCFELQCRRRKERQQQNYAQDRAGAWNKATQGKLHLLCTESSFVLELVASSKPHNSSMRCEAAPALPRHTISKQALCLTPT